MFGGLNRRRIKEQMMLLYQNAAASEGSLLGYFSGDGAAISLLGRMSLENREIGLSQVAGKPLPLDKIERLLAINKDLRRLYDSTASRHLKGFDEAHKPVMGWNSYLADRT